MFVCAGTDRGGPLILGQADPVAAQVLDTRTTGHALEVPGWGHFGGAGGEGPGVDLVDVVDEEREVGRAGPVGPGGVVQEPEQEEVVLPVLAEDEGLAFVVLGAPCHFVVEPEGLLVKDDRGGQVAGRDHDLDRAAAGLGDGHCGSLLEVALVGRIHPKGWRGTIIVGDRRGTEIGLQGRRSFCACLGGALSRHSCPGSSAAAPARGAAISSFNRTSVSGHVQERRPSCAHQCGPTREELTVINVAVVGAGAISSSHIEAYLAF
ncbi:MAG TPA: hypothetical protein VMF65_03060, partial [Acidimicrobiales bacterium]|nr:hypothetical protein [Acidimicrobiales bacterium]